MPVPSVITDLVPVAGDNSPAGTDTIGMNMDNYIRAHAAFISQLYADAQGHYDATSSAHVSTAVTFTHAATGSVLRTANAKMGDVVSAKDFGATGDGTTDDYAALALWVTALKTLVAPTALLPSGLYNIANNTLALDVPNDTTLIMSGSIKSTAVNKSAVVVGKSTGISERITVQGMKVVRTAIDYTGSSVGIELMNLVWSNIDIRSCFQFRIGVMAHGNGYGFTYNTISLGYIHDNRINLQLEVSNTPGGYCNECTWIGGSLNHSSGYDVATYNGINLEITHDGTNSINNHRFIGLSLEDAHASSDNTVAAIINGESNVLLWPRIERVVNETDYAIQFTSNSVRCSIAGNGFAIVNSNISDSGSQNEFQTSEGRRMVSSTGNTGGALGTGKAVLQLQSSNTSTARVLGVYAADGSESGYWKGTGDVRTIGEVRLGGVPSAGEVGYLTLGRQTQSTVGAAGGASALPATPSGYLRLFIDTTEYVVPYYAQA